VKSLLLALSMSVAALTLSVSPLDAEAKRLGAGKPAGMQRQMPAKPADATPHSPAAPAQNAAAPAAPPAPAAAPGKRSWMGPIAGLAAGLGIAALFSHFGMGAGLANFMMMAMLAVVAVVVVRWLVSRFAGGKRGPAFATASAGGNGGPTWQPMPSSQPLQREALQPLPQAAAPAAQLAAPVNNATANAAPATLPGGMAQSEFLRLAKMVFIRLQAANDAGNVEDLRKFTTPELFASLRVDLQERGASANVTDVVQLDAEVADVSQQNGQDIVSVRFHGLIREAAAAPAEPFNELWHLVRQSSGGDWAIAGITPLQ